MEGAVHQQDAAVVAARLVTVAAQHVNPGDAATDMRIVGVIENAAGVLVAVAPRVGGYVVVAWLAGIIINLLTLSGFYDIALRDFGLLVGALALARLAQGQHEARDVELTPESARHTA